MSTLTTIDFRGDTLFAVERDDGVYLAVSPICETLGLRPEKQRERIKNDPILSEGHAVVAFPSAGGIQETFCLRLDLVNGWLFTIDESRVRDEVRERVLAYKRECFAVLARHFQGRSAVADAIQPIAAHSPAVAVSMVRETRQTFGVLPARNMWRLVGLPIVEGMIFTSPQSDLFQQEAR